MASKSDWKSLMKTAKDQGWTVSKTRGEHLRWQAPTGKVVFSASTCSDSRGLANHRSLLRRNGLSI